VINGVFSIPLPAPAGAAPAAASPSRKRLPSQSGEFIVGPENRLARVATDTFLLPASSGSAFNPLVIYGPRGCGKSHLTAGLVAIWTERYPGANVCVIAEARDIPPSHTGYHSEKDQQEHDVARVDVAQDKVDVPGHTPSRHTAWRSTTLVVVEDLDHFSRQRSAQRQLESLIDRLQRVDGKLIVTATTAPAALTHLSPMLRSRLAAGLVVNLAAPHAAARTAIVQSHARLAGINLAEAAVDEVTRQLGSSSVAELICAVDNLAAGTTADKAGLIDEAAVRQFFCLRSAPGKTPSQVPMNRILNVVARQYGLKPADLRGRSRRRGIALARSMAMYLASRHAHYSLKKIGSSLGHRDHTTIMHGCRNIEKLLQSDATCRKLVNELIAELESEP